MAKGRQYACEEFFMQRVATDFNICVPLQCWFSLFVSHYETLSYIFCFFQFIKCLSPFMEKNIFHLLLMGLVTTSDRLSSFIPLIVN